MTQSDDDEGGGASCAISWHGGAVTTGRWAAQQSRGTRAESDAAWRKNQAITQSRTRRRRIVIGAPPEYTFACPSGHR